MKAENKKQLTVRFTVHQRQLLDRLMDQQQRWKTLNELILDAVREFADQHASEPRDEKND